MNPRHWLRITILLLIGGLLCVVTAVAQETPTQPAQPAASTAVAWASRTVTFTHTGVNTAVQVVDERINPTSGWQRIVLEDVYDNLALTADASPLAYTESDDPYAPLTRIDYSVPAGTAVLRITHDQLDTALGFEGTWHLNYTHIHGPTTLTITLPDDATILRYGDSGWATLVDSHTLRYAIPSGHMMAPHVVYETAVSPHQYDTYQTPHLTVSLPQPYANYHPAALSLLEHNYQLLQTYSGQDVNQIRGQDTYAYYYPPAGWYWWGSTIPLGGGLTVRGGPSAVRSSFVPYVHEPSDSPYHPLMAISAHEMGNGWWLLLHNDYYSITMPWWLDSEGHSGFLRANVERDLGYCEDAQREHNGHYADYLICKAAAPPGNRCGTLVEIMLISLTEQYGWDLMQQVYAGIQGGWLNFTGMSESEKDDAMISFMSHAVGENLVPFFDEHGIFATTAVRDELSIYPDASVPIIETLPCPPDQFRAAPDIVFDSQMGDAPATAVYTLYVGAPQQWTLAVTPDTPWLTVERDSDGFYTTLTVTIDTAGLTPDLYQAGITLSGAGIVNSPFTIPVYLTVWDAERVDHLNPGGIHNTLDTDSLGRNHMTYYDADSDTLLYTMQSMDVWQTEPVTTTNILTLETHMLLDSHDRPHMTFYDYTNDRLIYAHRPADQWQFTELAPGARYSALALDASSTPHIAYIDAIGNLFYTTSAGGGWQTEQIFEAVQLYEEDDTYWDRARGKLDLALDSNGQPQVGFMHRACHPKGCLFEVRLSMRDTGGWSDDDVFTWGGYGNPAPYNEHVDLALTTADTPHLLFEYDKRLYHAIPNGDEWLVTTVSDEIETYSDFMATISENDTLFVVIFDSSANTLYLAIHAHGAWAIQPVTSVGGDGSQIDLDHNGRPHITFYDSFEADLWYAAAGTAPAPVTDLTAVVGNSDIVLSWNAVTTSVQADPRSSITYHIYRTIDDPYFVPTGAPLATTTALTHTDPGAYADQQNYTYLVTAVDENGAASGVVERVGTFVFDIVVYAPAVFSN